jgi:putative sigma-54 modulation protein
MAMDIIVEGVDITLTDKIQTYAEKKLSRLDRYMPNLTEARLDLRMEKHKNTERPVAQLTIRNTRGTILRAEDRKQHDINAAVDIVVDKMYRQIERYKGKSKRGKKPGNGARWLENEAAWEAMENLPPVEYDDDEPDYDEVPQDAVVRRKQVLLTPMSEQEAIDQMEMLGHNFFLFYNGEEDTINVLYRRQEEGYGILTPRLD